MSEVTHTKPVAVAAPPFSFTQVLPWLIFAAMLFLVALYFISAEQGATSLLSGHRGARVGARRTPPARLPLPLSPAP